MFRKNNGQSLVETALTLPIILFLLMAILDFGMAMNNYILISNAAREGARAAAVGSSDNEIRTLISNYTSELNNQNITVSITPSDSTRKKGDEISVLIKYQYSLITPIAGKIFGNSILLQKSTNMRME
jgi:Flp pilus assembly protein TadG